MTNTSTQPAKSLRIPLLIATACLIGTACWVLAVGDNLPGKPNEKDQPVSAKDVMDFAAIYATNCAACHGADGKWGPAPPLNDPLFREIVPQKILEQVVSGGRPGTPMPGFARGHGGSLTAAQIQVLVNQIKAMRYKIVGAVADGAAEMKAVQDPNGIAPAWGSPRPADASAGAPPYEFDYAANGDSSDDDVLFGWPITVEDLESIRTTSFARACAGCHGDHGEGTESGGAINNPEFLALTSGQLLRRIIITGRPDLGMPDYRGTKKRPADFKPLTSTEIQNLVSLLVHWGQGKSASGHSKVGK